MARFIVLAMLPMIFTNADPNASKALRGTEGKRLLQAAPMCNNDIPGIQSKNSCCVAECGQCGGVGCSTAGGLTKAECCEGAIAISGVLCADSRAAPCIIDGAVTAPPAPTPPVVPEGECDGGIPGFQNKDICCAPGCGQCGGTGCSSAGGLTKYECCTKDIAEGGILCSASGEGPCILDGTGATPQPAPTTTDTAEPVASPPTMPSDSMCDGGIPGFQNKDICCAAACGQCGGSGCSSAGGLSATECCTKNVAASGVMCSVSGEGPCLLDGTGATLPPAPTMTMTPAPVAPMTPSDDMCSNGLPGIQNKNICCVAACGQCGGTGCSSAGGLTKAECCTKDIALAEMTCDITGAAPCIIIEGGPAPSPTKTEIPVEPPTDMATVEPTPMVTEPATPAPVLLGCYADVDVERIMQEVTESDTMTAELCAEACVGNKYYGLQYGFQCWCGAHGTDPLKHGESAECRAPCSGDADQVCGGVWAMSVYEYPPQPEPVPAYTKLGCYSDVKNNRVLHYVMKSPDMTTEYCASECAGKTFFGTQFGHECWCGSDRAEPLKHGESEVCDVPCEGNTKEICGGYLALNIYEYTEDTVTPTLAPVVPVTMTPVTNVATISPTAASTEPVEEPTEPKYMGCYADVDTDRIMELVAENFLMTIQMCRNVCASFVHFGLQYGIQCWCGDETTKLKHGESARCDTACPGSEEEICGGTYAMSVYTY